MSIKLGMHIQHLKIAKSGQNCLQWSKIQNTPNDPYLRNGLKGGGGGGGGTGDFEVS